VTVSLRSSSHQVVRRVLTDYDGRFQVIGLPNGEYEVVVEEPGCESDRAVAKVDGSVVNVEMHLKQPKPTERAASRYLVSVRELKMPDRARSEYEKGLDEMAHNDFAEGLRHFTKATEAFPSYYEAFNFIGIAEMKLGELEKAVQAFQRSIDLSEGRYAAALFGMGYTSYLQGKLKEAEDTLRRGLDIDGSSPDGYFYLGMTLFLENHIEEAEKSAREALLCKPDYAAAYIVLANVYGRRHEFHEQLQALDTYLKLTPNGPSAARVKEVRQVTLGILAGLKPANLTASNAQETPPR
jgi:tetratricopeptide (TPR) repeat protein